MLTVVEDESALAAFAAERLTSLIEASVTSAGSVCLCLTGGTTPRALYAYLADPKQPWRHRIDWPRLHLFWGDERHVPPDHQDSNFGMARDAMIQHVPVSPAHIHRMRGELASAEEAAREYDADLRLGFKAAGRTDVTFDVLLLGVGDDAHIASIFPGSPLLRHLADGAPADAQRSGNGTHSGALAAAIWAPHLGAWRITLTPKAILDARTIVVLVAGANKSGAVRAALRGPRDVTRWPVQLLRTAGDRVEWIIDRPAAAGLDER